MGIRKILSFLGFAKKAPAEFGGLERAARNQQLMMRYKQLVAKEISVFGK